jgi:beta-1,4-N-acetylglucosaminyltransferase
LLKITTLWIYRGTYKPTKLHSDKIKIEVHSFIVLDALIMESDLVISHCGAGILLECLRSPGTTNLAVVNDTLMHNHQTELADKLSSEGYIYQSVPSKVLE